MATLVLAPKYAVHGQAVPGATNGTDAPLDPSRAPDSLTVNLPTVDNKDVVWRSNRDTVDGSGTTPTATPPKRIKNIWNIKENPIGTCGVEVTEYTGSGGPNLKEDASLPPLDPTPYEPSKDDPKYFQRKEEGDPRFKQIFYDEILKGQREGQFTLHRKFSKSALETYVLQNWDTICNTGKNPLVDLHPCRVLARFMVENPINPNQGGADGEAGPGQFMEGTANALNRWMGTNYDRFNMNNNILLSGILFNYNLRGDVSGPLHDAFVNKEDRFKGTSNPLLADEAYNCGLRRSIRNGHEPKIASTRLYGRYMDECNTFLLSMRDLACAKIQALNTTAASVTQRGDRRTPTETP